MTHSIEYTDSRLQVMWSLQSMSDLTLQARWGQYEEGVNHYDDLTLNVHILYDDYAVLPDPASCVPAYLRTEEVPALLELERAFGPMLADLRDLPDDLYRSDRRWPAVIAASEPALRLMERLDDGSPWEETYWRYSKLERRPRDPHP